MIKILLILFLLVSAHTFSIKTYAIEDPTIRQNNKFGIHILYPTELEHAATLVNSSGGEWGYVTIPIQSNDRDLEKWQSFMDECKRLKLIPLIRIATTGDYFDTSVWTKPTDKEIADFSNFLSSINWPVKNRYILFFNEVNRNDEWGGDANPQEYAELLSLAVAVFKSKNQDFFIIAGGFDNASINSPTAINKLSFIEQMDEAVPGIFNMIDGYSTHAYPNPEFSQHPLINTDRSIHSFKYEMDLIKDLSIKPLPIFITETGWSKKYVSDLQQSEYYRIAFQNVWREPSIIAVTPFLLFYPSEPFEVFSFMDQNLQPSLKYTSYQKLPKVKGKPTIMNIKNDVLSESDSNLPKVKYNNSNKDYIKIKNATSKAFEFLMRI